MSLDCFLNLLIDEAVIKCNDVQFKHLPSINSKVEFCTQEFRCIMQTKLLQITASNTVEHNIFTYIRVLLFFCCFINLFVARAKIHIPVSRQN